MPPIRLATAMLMTAVLAVVLWQLRENPPPILMAVLLFVVLAPAFILSRRSVGILSSDAPVPGVLASWFASLLFFLVATIPCFLLALIVLKSLLFGVAGLMG